MAALLRLFAARCRESVLARPYGGAAGGGRDGARRGSGAGGGGGAGADRRGSGAGGVGGADRRGTGGRRRSSRSRSAGGERSRDAGGCGPRGQHDDGARADGGADHGRSFWSRLRDRARRRWARSRENSSQDSPSFGEIFDQVENTVEMLERVEKLPGRAYDLGKKLQGHLKAAGITLGAVGIFLKGKIKQTVSSVKEKISPVKEELSQNKIKPDDDEGGDSRPGPFDFSM